jgi:hypothetical protein
LRLAELLRLNQPTHSGLAAEAETRKAQLDRIAAFRGASMW